MKKNNIIFCGLVIILGVFIFFRFFWDDVYDYRNNEANNVTEFVLESGKGQYTKKQEGYYDFYNNSDKDSVLDMGGIKEIYPPSSSYNNFQVFENKYWIIEGDGKLTYKPSEFIKYNGDKFHISNGEYIGGDDIPEGNYRVYFEPISDKAEIELVQGRKGTRSDNEYSSFTLKSSNTGCEIEIKDKDEIRIKSYELEEDTSGENYIIYKMNNEKVFFEKIN